MAKEGRGAQYGDDSGEIPSIHSVTSTWAGGRVQVMEAQMKHDETTSRRLELFARSVFAEAAKACQTTYIHAYIHNMYINACMYHTFLYIYDAYL